MGAFPFVHLQIMPRASMRRSWIAQVNIQRGLHCVLRVESQSSYTPFAGFVCVLHCASLDGCVVWGAIRRFCWVRFANRRQLFHLMTIFSFLSLFSTIPMDSHQADIHAEVWYQIHQIWDENYTFLEWAALMVFFPQSMQQITSALHGWSDGFFNIRFRINFVYFVVLRGLFILKCNKWWRILQYLASYQGFSGNGLYFIVDDCLQARRLN